MRSTRVAVTVTLMLTALVGPGMPAPAASADTTGTTVIPAPTEGASHADGATLEGDLVRGVFGTDEGGVTRADGTAPWMKTPLHTLRAGATTADDVTFTEGRPTWRVGWTGSSAGSRDLATSAIVLSRDGTLIAVYAGDHWSIQSPSEDTELYAAPSGAVAFDGRTVWSWSPPASALTAVDLDRPGAAPRIVETGVTEGTNCATTLTVRGRWALLQCDGRSTLVDLEGVRPNWVVPTMGTGLRSPQLGAGFVAFPRTSLIPDSDLRSLYVVRADTHDMVEIPGVMGYFNARRFGVDTAAADPAPGEGARMARLAYADQDGLVNVATIELTDPARDEFDEAAPVVVGTDIPAQVRSTDNVTVGFTLADVGTGGGVPSGLYDAVIVVRRILENGYRQQGYRDLRPVEGDVELTIPMDVPVGGKLCAAVQARDQFGNVSQLSQERCADAVGPPSTTILSATSSVGNQVSLRASVTSDGSPVSRGVVTFFKDGQEISSAPVSAGQATYSSQNVSRGPHTYAATYVPARYEIAGSDSEVVTVFVRDAPTMVLTALPERTPYGQGRVARVSVDGLDAPASGIVELQIDDARPVTAPLSDGVVSFMLPGGLGVGFHEVVATYTGSAELERSSRHVMFEVSRGATAVSETFPSVVAKRKRAAGTVQAHVVPSSTVRPTGTVVVMKGGSVIGRGALRNGAAALTLARLPKGRHTLTMSYQGSTNSAPVKRSFTVTQR